MMKLFRRIVCLVTALALVCGLTAAAPAEEPFVFRGGLRWGVGISEVNTVENAGPNATEIISRHIFYARYYDQPQTYSDDACYFFIDGSLRACLLFSRSGGWSLDQIMPAIYGEADHNDVPSAVRLVFEGLGGSLSDFQTSSWTPCSDTAVCMLSQEDSSYRYILYADTTADWSLMTYGPYGL